MIFLRSLSLVLESFGVQRVKKYNVPQTEQIQLDNSASILPCFVSIYTHYCTRSIHSKTIFQVKHIFVHNDS